MGIAEGIRSVARNTIDKLGSTAYLYSFSGATVVENNEGEDNISSWGSATTIKCVSINHFHFRRMIVNQGLESDEGDRALLIRDDVIVAAKDKLVIDDEVYEIINLKKIDPIENITPIQRIVLARNERYK